MDSKKREKIVGLLSDLVTSLSAQEKNVVLTELLGKREGFPISIFRSSLSGLEAMTVFLKDNKGKNIMQISSLLNRRPSTLYTTYHKAKKKLRKPLDHSDTSVIIPFDIFTERNFSVLETIVAHLKDKHDLTFARISQLLDKNYNTIRTVYVRYTEKCQK